MWARSCDERDRSLSQHASRSSVVSLYVVRILLFMGGVADDMVRFAQASTKIFRNVGGGSFFKCRMSVVKKTTRGAAAYPYKSMY